MGTNKQLDLQSQMEYPRSANILKGGFCMESRSKFYTLIVIDDEKVRREGACDVEHGRNDGLFYSSEERSDNLFSLHIKLWFNL